MLRPPKKPTLALDSSIVQDNVPIEVVPKLYIGSIHAAFNQEALKDLRVTHILNASRLPATFPKQFTYFSVDIRDKESANILSCIPASNIFIEAGLESGAVLVHCFGGRSRSAAFIMAYLMSSFGWSYDSAVSVIRSVRPIASINKGFENQLRAYSLVKFDVYLAQQVLLRKRMRFLRQQHQWRRERAANITSDSTTGAGAVTSTRSDHFSPPLGVSRSAACGSSGALFGVFGAGHKKRTWGDVKEAAPASTTSVVNGNTNVGESKDGNSDRSSNTSVASGGGSSGRGFRGGSTAPPTGVGVTMDVRSPHCRLSRPGATPAMRVIPPLRGLERTFCCSVCGISLFSLGNVIRLDLNVLPFLGPPSDILDWTAGFGLGDTAAGNKMSFRYLSQSADAKGCEYDMGGAGNNGDDLSAMMCSPGTGVPDIQDTMWGEERDGRPTLMTMRAEPSSMSGNQRAGRGFRYEDDTQEGTRFMTGAVAVAAPKYNIPCNNARSPRSWSTQHEFKEMAPFDPVVSPSSARSAAVFTTRPPSFSRPSSATDPLAYNAYNERPSSGSGFSEFKMSEETDSTGLQRAGSNMSPLFVQQRKALSDHSKPTDLTSESISTSRPETKAMYDTDISHNGSYSSGCEGASPTQLQLHHHTQILERDNVRPQSVEKSRWLARMNLLRCPAYSPSRVGSVSISDMHRGDERTAKLAADDEAAVRLGLDSSQEFIFVEHLEWMNPDMTRVDVESGSLSCVGCRTSLGDWNWNPSTELCRNGVVEAPVIRIHKSLVHRAEMLLDATPAGTPCRSSRSDSAFSDSGGSSSKGDDAGEDDIVLRIAESQARQVLNMMGTPAPHHHPSPKSHAESKTTKNAKDDWEDVIKSAKKKRVHST